MKRFLTALCLILAIALSAEIVHKDYKKKDKKQSTAEILHLTGTNLHEILDSYEYIIVDIYTDWCGPCKYMAPIFSELNGMYGNQYLFTKLNAEEERGITSTFLIQGFPTILFIKNGVEVGRELGFMNKDKFISKMNKYFDN
jgi:thioredoxin 1